MKGKTVLIVEDDFYQRRVLELMLNKLENPPKTVHSKGLSEAIHYLKTEPIDLVLLDLKLGNSSWENAISSILELNPSQPIVIVSGQSDPQVIKKAIRLGAADYLVKGGYSLPEFLQSIKGAFNWASQEHAYRTARNAI